MDGNKAKKRRARRRLRGAKRLLLIVLMIALTYGVFGLGRAAYQWVFFPPVRYVEARAADSAIFTGYAMVLRNELALVASRAGALNKLVDHGSKVRSGEHLFELVDMSLLSSIDKQLAETDARDAQTKVPEEVLVERRQQLAASLAAVRTVAAEVALGVRLGDANKVAQAWRELTRAQQTARRLEQEYAFATRTDTAGQERRNELLMQRQQAIHVVRAPKVGYISFEAAGDIGAWAASEYNAVTLDVLRTKRGVLKMRQNGDHLPAGQPVCIIVDSSMAVLMIEAQATLELPPQVDISFGDAVLKAQVLPRMLTGVEGTVLFPLRLDNPPFALLEQRGASIVVRPRGAIFSQLPSSALVTGTVTKVYVQTSAGEHVAREVKVIETKGRNVVVTGVVPLEIVVANPKRLIPTGSAP